MPAWRRTWRSTSHSRPKASTLTSFGRCHDPGRRRRPAARGVRRALRTALFRTERGAARQQPRDQGRPPQPLRAADLGACAAAPAGAHARRRTEYQRHTRRQGRSPQRRRAQHRRERPRRVRPGESQRHGRRDLSTSLSAAPPTASSAASTTTATAATASPPASWPAKSPSASPFSRGRPSPALRPRDPPSSTDSLLRPSNPSISFLSVSQALVVSVRSFVYAPSL